MRYALILLLLPLAACSSIPGLGAGGVTGSSTINLTCGTTTVTYSSGLVPSTAPVMASCIGPDGKSQSAGITPAIDPALIKAAIAAAGVAS